MTQGTEAKSSRVSKSGVWRAEADATPYPAVVIGVGEWYRRDVHMLTRSQLRALATTDEGSAQLSEGLGAADAARRPAQRKRCLATDDANDANGANGSSAAPAAAKKARVKKAAHVRVKPPPKTPEQQAEQRATRATRRLMQCVTSSPGRDKWASVVARAGVLLAMRASPDGPDPMNVCPPLCHANASDNLELARLLLESKANPHYMGTCRWTVLYDACRRQDTSWVKLLLEHGADPAAGVVQGRRVATSATTCEPGTPLVRGCGPSWGAAVIVPLMLKAGAPAAIVDITRFCADAPGTEIRLLMTDMRWATVVICLDHGGLTPPQPLSDTDNSMKDAALRASDVTIQTILNVLLSVYKQHMDIVSSVCSDLPDDLVRLVTNYHWCKRWFQQQLADALCVQRIKQLEAATAAVTSVQVALLERQNALARAQEGLSSAQLTVQDSLRLPKV
jgi:hypothetical protein